MKCFSSSFFKCLTVRLFAVICILILGNSNVLHAQCTITNTGTITAPTTCAGGSTLLGAGESRNMTFVAGVEYTFSFTNNGQSNGMCINGTQYTSTTSFKPGAVTWAVGIYRSSSTWPETGGTSGSATLTYVCATPTQTSGGAGTYCTSGTVTNSVTSSFGTSYWQGTTSGGTNTGTSATSESVSSSGTYYYNTDNGGCWSGTTAEAVTIVAQPTLATLASASPSNGTTICVGYDGPEATITAGTGGSGSSDTYTYSINNGGSSAAYTSGSTINSSGGSSDVVVYASRSAGTGTGCNAVPATAIATWPIVAQPARATLASASPANGATICLGYNGPEATITAGTGGSGSSDTYTYSINNGGSTAAYTSGNTINSSGGSSDVVVYASRSAGTGTGCNAVPAVAIATWPIVAQPTLATAVGTPASGTTICVGYDGPSAAITAGTGGSGSSDTYTYSINNGGSTAAYTSGNTINSSGGSSDVVVYASRSAGTGTGCNAVPATAIATWPIVAQPTLATAVGTPASGTTICVGYNGPSAAITAGTGGSGSSDTYTYSINNGGSTAAYTSGSTINSSGGSSDVVVYASRSAGTGTGCNAVPATAIATWPIVAQPARATLASASPANGATICLGYNGPEATITAGTGGSGSSDTYTYSINNGGSTAAYTSGNTINSSGGSSDVVVYASRSAGTGTGCNAVPAAAIATWPIVAQPTLATAVGTPASGTTICVGYDGPSAAITAGTGGSGSSDTYTYSINNGGSTAAYTSGNTINSSGGSSDVVVYASRSAGTGTGCNAIAATAIATWPIVAQPALPTLSSASPSNGTAVCIGYNGPSANITAGTGGSGSSDVYTYSINNGGSTAAYINNASINTTGGTGSAIVYVARTAGSGSGCNAVGPSQLVQWPLDPQPTLTTTTLNGTTYNVCPGGNFTFDVTAVPGVSNATGFQWQYNSGSGWTNISNGTPANVTYNVTTTTNHSTLEVITATGVTTGVNFEYQCVVSFSGSGCTSSLTEGSGILNVSPQPSITEPGIAFACSGSGSSSTATIDVVLSGGANPVYTWYYSSNGSPVADNTPNGFTYSGTESTSSLTATIANGSSFTGAEDYYCVVSFTPTSGCTPSTLTTTIGNSSIGVIDVGAQPSVATQPSSIPSLCSGNTGTFTTLGANGTVLAYQWQYKNGSSWVNVADNAPVTGITYGGTGNATTLDINTALSTAPGTYSYQCVISSIGSNCDNAYTNTVTVTVNTTPSSFTPTVSANPVCNGSSTNIQIPGSSSSVTYELQSLPGPTNIVSHAGTGSTLSLSTGNISASTNYQVLATEISGSCTYLAPIQDTVVVVNPDIAIGTQLPSDHFTFGTIGSPALPSGWSNPTTSGLQWTLATSNPASSGNYSYYNGSGGTSSASTGAYITTPTGASTTTVSLITGSISTANYTNISVQWGAQKSAGYAGTVSLYYSTNGGSTWNGPVSFTDVQDDVTGDAWTLVNNTVQVKLPVACNNTTIQLKWTANAAGSGIYYSMNDIGIYGLNTINNCGTSSISLPYLNTSCSASKYSIASTGGTWTDWSTLTAVNNASLPASPVSITVPANTTAGTYDVDFTVNDGSGHSSSTISFPVTTDPVLDAAVSLDNCSCLSGTNYGNVVTAYAGGGSGSYTFTPLTGIDVLNTTIGGVKGVFWAKSDNTSHSFTVSDGYCSKTVSVTTQNGEPTQIPFGTYSGVPSAIANGHGGNNIKGSFCDQNLGNADVSRTDVQGKALTCHQPANFGNQWLMYQINNGGSTGNTENNEGVVEINNYGQNLDSVTVSVYREPNLPVVDNAATQTTACYGYPGYALERHFMIKSDIMPSGPSGANSFTTHTVGVRLYFSDAELQDLEYWTQYVATQAQSSGGQTAGCADLDVLSNISNIYVTKYTYLGTGTNNEDGSYTNNSAAPTGLYRVFGVNANSSGNGPLASIDGVPSNSEPSPIIATGSGTTVHYVEANVSEFSEFWFSGSSGGDPLPVSMLYLQAQELNNDSIQITWATATEVNNHEFDVERSTDGETWTTIGIVPGHDNSTQQIDYVYNDVNVAPGVRYYYRLKQVDNNGNYQYTDIVQAMITASGTFTVMNFVPNPTAGTTQLTVITSKNQEITVDFYNMLGQRVLSATEQLVPGSNIIPFDLSRFAAGTYSAVVTAENQLYTKKIVIAGK